MLLTSSKASPRATTGSPQPKKIPFSILAPTQCQQNALSPPQAAALEPGGHSLPPHFTWAEEGRAAIPMKVGISTCRRLPAQVKINTLHVLRPKNTLRMTNAQSLDLLSISLPATASKKNPKTLKAGRSPTPATYQF